MTSRFSVLDLSRLPPPKVIDALDAEAVLADRMAKLKALWSEYDPPLGAAYDVESLEFDPIKIVQELDSYFHLMLQDRVNQAARAVTLAFASSSDLDTIASRYPGGVPRQAGESDERYRRRIWLSANSFTSAGSGEAYVFHALTAEPSLSDASAVSRRPTPDDPQVIVTCLSSRDAMIPTGEELNRVRAVVLSPGIKPVTDVCFVLPPTIVETAYRASVWLYPGPDGDLLMDEIEASVGRLIAEQRVLGHDHTLNALHAALKVPGVQNAIILEPAADVFVDPTQVVRVTGVEIELAGRSE